MYEQKMEDIRKLAHAIDSRINLFEGYCPKEMDGYSGQMLYWRQIVNIYGLLADCDKVQIKEKANLIELLCRYSLISNDDYQFARRFWDDVSALRGWLCHNNDITLPYVMMRGNKICEYLKKAFLIASDKPNTIEEIKPKDWSILTADIQRRFEAYLDILNSGLEKWKISEYREEMLDEWIKCFSKALYSDGELLQNVLLDLAEYDIRNGGIWNIRPPQLAKQYYNQLKDGGFSVDNIQEELKSSGKGIRTNREIIADSVRNSHLIS